MNKVLTAGKMLSLHFFSSSNMALLLFKKGHRNLAHTAIVTDAFFLIIRGFFVLMIFTLPYMLCCSYVFVKHGIANGYRDSEAFP